jgi:hypothetical protein
MSKLMASIVIGDFVIMQYLDGSIGIYHSSGEGGIFNEKELEKAIGDFYNKNF